MRLWLTVLLWFTVVIVSPAASVILFISPAKAGPAIPLAIDDQPNWVRWPTPAAGNGLNRLLSIPSGIDWEGTDRNFAFKPKGDHQWQSKGLADLQRRGYAVALSKRLGSKRILALESADGAVSRLALTVAADPRYSAVDSVPADQPLNPSGIYVGEAKSWDEVQLLQRRGADRILVVEYPPIMPGHYSHVWMRGPEWENLAVAAPTKGADGYLAATDLLPLLLSEPTRIVAIEPWKTPRRWIAFAYGPAKVAVALGFLILMLGLAAITWSVVEERRVPWRQELALASLLVPAAWMNSGWLCRWLGPDQVVGWLIIALLFLVLVNQVIRRWMGNEALLATFLTAFAATMTGEVIYGPISPVFTNSGGLCLGIALGYLVGLASYVPRQSATASWLVRVAAPAFILLPVSETFCLSGVTPTLLIGLTVAALAAGERWVPPIYLWLIAMLLPFTKGIGHGYVFSRHELYANFWDTQAVNFASIAAQMTRLEWPIVFAAALAVVLIGFRFLRHQLRRLHRIDPRVDGLLAITVAWGIVGSTVPALLPAVPILLLISLITIQLDVTLRV